MGRTPPPHRDLADPIDPQTRAPRPVALCYLLPPAACYKSLKEPLDVIPAKVVDAPWRAGTQMIVIPAKAGTQ